MLFGLTAGTATAEPFTTGSDWVKSMSPGEKLISLIAPYMLMENHRIPMKKPITEYVSAVDKVLFAYPHLQSEDIANVFASTVYAYEPQCRNALEAMASYLARRKTNWDEGYFPRVTIRRDYA